MRQKCKWYYKWWAQGHGWDFEMAVFIREAIQKHLPACVKIARLTAKGK